FNRPAAKTWISLAAKLPAIQQNGTIINGESQAHYKGVPLVKVDGDDAGDGANGFTIKSTGWTVQDLTTTLFDHDGVCSGGTDIAQHNGGKRVIHNFIEVNGGSGVEIVDSKLNQIGSTTKAGEANPITGNLISINDSAGIYIAGISNLNAIWGNYIGTDVDG